MKARIHGLDVARALAILGMAYNHLGAEGSVFYNLASGFPAALFAVLSGFSLCIMARKGNEQGGQELIRARYRLLIRGVLILGLGIVLSIAQSTIVVVLGSIAAILLLLGPVTNRSTKYLLWLLVAVGGIGSLIQVGSAQWGIYASLLTGPYPIFAWLAYGIIGILGYRYILHSVKVQAIVAPLGIAIGAASIPWRGESSPQLLAAAAAAEMPQSDDSLLVAWLGVRPHSGALGDIAVSSAMALGVTALCLLLCRPVVLNRALYPLRAVGSMALTAYVLHCMTAGLLLSGLFGLIGDPVESGSDIKAGVAVPYVDSGEDAMGGLEWSKYQELVAQSPGWSEFWDAESAAMAGTAAGSVADNDGVDRNPFAFLTTIIGLMLFASLWKIRKPKGPVEGWISGVESRLLSA